MFTVSAGVCARKKIVGGGAYGGDGRRQAEGLS